MKRVPGGRHEAELAQMGFGIDDSLEAKFYRRLLYWALEQCDQDAGREMNQAAGVDAS